ncbi:MAG: thioredoxin domain-containing protein [Acidobacteriia bacterium]|nr:thioredoxin domain-containing protein [Terriglobia bacterium]
MQHRYLNYLFLVLLFTVLAGGQQAPVQAHSPNPHHPKAVDPNHLPSEETVNAFLRQTFGYDASLSWKIADIRPSEAEGLAEVDVTISGPQGAQSQKFYVTPDGHHAVIGEILPFGAHPYDSARKQLEKGVTGPTHGPADAAVTVVEFSDLQCPHCKEAQPTLERLMAEDKDVRVVFQNFPLPMHDWAMKGAAFADCVGRSSHEAFWKFISNVYGAQSDITAANVDEKLTALADNAGVKGTDVAACAANPETTSRIERSVDLGRSLEVNSTPTIFINGRKLSSGGLPYEVLQKLVDFAAKEPRTAAP